MSDLHAIAQQHKDEVRDWHFRIDHVFTRLANCEALIAKIQAIVEEAYPDERHSDFDVLHQGVRKLLTDKREVQQQTRREDAESMCPRCRSKLPLVMRNGSLMHEYHKNHDYRECYAHAVYALMPDFLLSLAKGE